MTAIHKTNIFCPEAKRPIGRPRHRREENIKMDLQELECGDMDWI